MSFTNLEIMPWLCFFELLATAEYFPNPSQSKVVLVDNILHLAGYQDTMQPTEDC